MRTKRFWAVVLLLMMAVSLVPKVTFAAAGDPPAHDKTLTVNNDGTYTIALSVTGDSEKTVHKVNVIVVVDTSWSMYYPSGNSGQNRIQATRAAVHDLAAALLAYNGGDNPDDTVEMALVTFDDHGNIVQNPTSNSTTYLNRVDALNYAQGNYTNWEDAFDTAGDVDFDDTDTTFVIFVSDGVPTLHKTDGGYGDWNRQKNCYGSGNESEPNVTHSYDEAVDDARALAQSVGVKNFYTIFAFGDDDQYTYGTGAEILEKLTTEAGAPASNAFDARNTEALEAAFDSILSDIESAGIGTVSMSDGTTSSVTTESGEIANLLTVDQSSYKYYRSGGSYSTTANGGLGDEWSDAPTATFENGAVKWDLSSEGVLENEVTYTVTFDCWPSQTTLDIIADIKNDPSEYDKLDPEIQKYITRNGDLRTNTSASLTYVDTRTGQSGSATYENPDPVETVAAKQLAVSKEWENELDGQEAKPITLKVTCD
ncbi:MAG: VWA domain-containing protein, partial [Clostridia bacterium]|nr:VWA domain-containing protein [Clostridia bacterium]